ncbi:hypothetical protein V6N11_040051 [Hibiscus sabdariffa]|uniref:Uncharacterized protein n=1 Tax=Hibiscus sabdariffa TaxID=183260 RepID=A0ABR2RGB0_9ROSI
MKIESSSYWNWNVGGDFNTVDSTRGMSAVVILIRFLLDEAWKEDCNNVFEDVWSKARGSSQDSRIGKMVEDSDAKADIDLLDRFDHSYTGVSTDNKENQDGGGFNNNTGYSQKFEKSAQSYTHVVNPPINQSGFFAPPSHGVFSSFGQPLPGVAAYPVSCSYGSPMLPHFSGNPYFSFAGVGPSSDSIPSARVVQDCHCESTFRNTYEHGHVMNVGYVQDVNLHSQLDPSTQSTNRIDEISGGFQEDKVSPREGFSSSVPLEAGSLGNLPYLQVETEETNSAPLVTDFLEMTEDASQAQVNVVPADQSHRTENRHSMVTQRKNGIKKPKVFQVKVSVGEDEP